MDVVVGDTLAWAWPLLLALVALPLISIVNGLGQLTALQKKIAVLVVSLVLALIYIVASGMISEVPVELSQQVTRWLVIAAIIVVVTQAVYNFFKPVLTNLEDAVSTKEVTHTDESEA